MCTSSNVTVIVYVSIHLMSADTEFQCCTCIVNFAWYQSVNFCSRQQRFCIAWDWSAYGNVNSPKSLRNLLSSFLFWFVSVRENSSTSWKSKYDFAGVCHIITGWTTMDSWFLIPGRSNKCLFCNMCRLALMSTLSAIQWVSRGDAIDAWCYAKLNQS
jgi:hypothetical protein